MVHTNNTDFLKLQDEARNIAEEVRNNFAGLSKEELNWKPNPKSWSIAQCLEHLINSNRCYFPTFEEIILGEKKRRFLERIPFVSDFWGKLFIKSLSPESERKLKSPKLFMPTTSDIDNTIISQFSDNQGRLIGFIQATSCLDMKHTFITSPATRFVTYSLHNAYEIILQHERRHLSQALRVLKMNSFAR